MTNQINIFTFHYAYNYGAFLQAFALLKVNNDFKIANLNKTFKVDSMSCIGYNGKKYLPVVWRIISLFRYLRKNARKARKRHFDEEAMFGLTEPLLKLSKKQMRKKLNDSIAICGSDQIWNPTMIMGREDVFFANVANFSKRISYAASLGMGKWPAIFEKRSVPLLKKFDAISVREELSVKYLESLGIKNVACVCDPTILHSAEFYRTHFSYIRKNTERPFFYRIREQFPNNLNSLFSQTDMVDLKDSSTIVSVSDWLKLIDNSTCVCTDSFHGTVFSLLFHKPFLVVPNMGSQKGMNERFKTLLKKTNLEYRCISCDEGSEDLFAKLNTPIDWGFVDSVLEEWRTFSLNWLKNALES